MRQIARGVFKISEGLDRIAGWFLVMAMILVVSNVISRFIGKPIMGVYEWMSFLMVFVSSWALASCSVHNGHVGIDILMDRMPVKVVKIIDFIISLISSMFLFFIAWHSFIYGNSYKIARQVSPTTQIIIYPFVFAVGLGILVLGMVVLVKLIENLKKKELR